MLKIIIALIFVLSVSTVGQQQVKIDWPSLADSPWPMIKHDPQFTGRSPYKGPQTPTIVWTEDMEDGIFSGPVIGKEGNLFFGSYFVFANSFYSFNSDGTFRWEYETGGSRAPASGIVIDSSNTIYFGSRDSNLYALNLDGTLKWKHKTSERIPETAIPNIDLQGNIYITNFIFDNPNPDQGELYSIKPDGTLNWKVMYDNGFAFKSPVFSPDGNTIYIAGVDSNLFALNLDGSIKWKFSCGVIRKVPMVDSFGNLYFTPIQSPQYFYSLKPDGSVRWNYKLLLQTDNYSIPTIDHDGNLYSIGRDTTCCPIYPKLFSLTFDGDFRWQYIFDEDATDQFYQPLICDSDGTVYVGSTYGYYYYAITSKGELKWKLPLNGQQQQVDNTGAIAEDGTLYLGVHDASLFTGQKKTLIAIRDTGTVSVNENNADMSNYALLQNYPNPFNQITTISYQIKEPGLVQLKVYDILGREVATLVNENKPEGDHSIAFDAVRLPSGVYLYSMRLNDFVQNRKMIMMK